MPGGAALHTRIRETNKPQKKTFPLLKGIPDPLTTAHNYKDTSAMRPTLLQGHVRSTLFDIDW